jgi:hypothetical protein
MSARALPGRRVDWYRAGMIAIAETGTRKEEGPVPETGGTADITTLTALIGVFRVIRGR